jgi:hypothetical protein
VGKYFCRESSYDDFSFWSKMNAKPVFIHSLFRSGSTYLFEVFRRSSEGYWCYQEPLNEHLLDRSDAAFWSDSQQQDSRVAYLRHPKLNKPYFFEFTQIKDIVLALFRPEFCFEMFFLTPGQQASELCSYIGELINHARGRAVLQCCRSVGRMNWARFQSDAIHIYLWRNPWDQWWSYKVDSYFDLTNLAVYGADRVPDFLMRIRAESGLTLSPYRDHLPDWSALQREIALHTDHVRSYLLFYALWLYGLIESRSAADVSVNIDMLSESAEYRGKVLARLSALGLTGIELSDANVPRSVYGEIDRSFFSEIEIKVHELFLKTGYKMADLEWILTERHSYLPFRQKPHFETILPEEARVTVEEIFKLRKIIQKYGAEFQDKKNFAIVLEAKAREVEYKAKASEVRAREIERRLNETEATLARIYRSKSWRLTAPLRESRLYVKGSLHFMGASISALRTLTRRIVRGVVRSVLMHLEARPQFKAMIISAIGRFPFLESRLRVFYRTYNRKQGSYGKHSSPQSGGDSFVGNRFRRQLELELSRRRRGY